MCTPNRIFAGPDLAFCILHSLSLSGDSQLWRTDHPAKICIFGKTWHFYCIFADFVTPEHRFTNMYRTLCMFKLANFWGGHWCAMRGWFEEVVLVIRHKELVIGSVDSNYQIILFSFSDLSICPVFYHDLIRFCHFLTKLGFLSSLEVKNGQETGSPEVSSRYWTFSFCKIVTFIMIYFTYHKKKPRKNNIS